MSESKNNNLQLEKISLLPAIFLCIIQLGTITDNTALLNASSAIASTFHTDISQIQIANIMYPLMAGGIMVAGGFLGKIIGWKRLVQIGLLVLVIGEILVVISPTITIFVYVARVLVGIGASLAIPAILGLITVLYKNKQQAVVFGLIAATIAFASAIAPVITGYIIVYLSWEIAFVLVILLFAISFFYISFFIRKDNLPNTKKSFDFMGLLLLFFGLCITIMGLSNIVKWGLITPRKAPFTIFSYSPVLLFVIVGIALLVLLFYWERSLEKRKGVDKVLIPVEFITNRQTLSAVSMNAFIYLSLGGGIFMIFIFLQLFFNATAITTGYVMMVFAVGMVPFSIFTPQLAGNFSPRLICISGILISFLGCIAVGYGISATGGVEILFYIGMFVLGIGSGLVASQSSFITAASIKDKKLASQSSGLQGAMRNIGQAASIAIISAVYISIFTYSVKNDINGTKTLSSNLRQKVKQMEVIPVSDKKTVLKILKTKYSLPVKEGKEVFNMYWKSSVDAFRYSCLILGIIMLLFILFAKDITSEKLKVLQQAKE